jgi:hypothetical protein
MQELQGTEEEVAGGFCGRNNLIFMETMGLYILLQIILFGHLLSPMPMSMPLPLGHMLRWYITGVDFVSRRSRE